MTLNTDIAALSVPEQIFLWLRTNMMDIAGGIAVLVIGLLVAGLIARWISNLLTKSDRLEPSVAGLLASLVKYALWVVVGVTVLTQFGVKTTSIIAALGGMALAVGLALQGTLSNVASGVMILVQKPFKVGELVVGIGLRVWCDTPDYVGLTWDLTEAVKAKFDETGISMPFPQREVTTKAA